MKGWPDKITGAEAGGLSLSRMRTCSSSKLITSAIWSFAAGYSTA
jgi:hypothetical protein